MTTDKQTDNQPALQPPTLEDLAIQAAGYLEALNLVESRHLASALRACIRADREQLENEIFQDATDPAFELKTRVRVVDGVVATVDALSGLAPTERLSTQEDKPMKNYDDFRAGMLRAAQMARDEFKRAPNAAKGHDCVYMGGYEDACDHLSVVIAQAAVIDSVRIAGAQPDWQYHISLLLPEEIEDTAVLRIYQVVEHELRRAAATAPIAATVEDSI